MCAVLWFLRKQYSYNQQFSSGPAKCAGLRCFPVTAWNSRGELSTWTTNLVCLTTARSAGLPYSLRFGAISQLRWSMVSKSSSRPVSNRTPANNHHHRFKGERVERRLLLKLRECWDSAAEINTAKHMSDWPKIHKLSAYSWFPNLKQNDPVSALKLCNINT